MTQDKTIRGVLERVWYLGNRTDRDMACKDAEKEIEEIMAKDKAELLTLCPHCFCMTKNICGKCNAEKRE